MDILEKKYSDSLSAELKRAVEFHRTGQVDRAEGVYLNILKAIPEQSEVLHLLGVIAHQKGNNDKAEKMINRAVQLAPDNPIFLNSLGTVFKVKGALTKALGCYQMAIQIDPNHFEAHLKMGILLHEQGCLDDAICSYQKAIDLKPNLTKAYYYIAIAFHDRGVLDKAIFYYRKAVALKPDFVEAYNSMGTAWQSLENFDKALSCFQKAIDLMPASDAVYVNKGNVFQAQGKYNKALTCYRKSIEINPENAVAYLNMGISLMDSGKTAEATSSYRKALEINPDYAKACTYLVSRLQQDCAWKELERWGTRLDDLTISALDREERPAETPFLNITRHADPKLNLAVARLWCRKMNQLSLNSEPSFSFHDRLFHHRKITVGYLSSNFRNHPTAHLIFDLFRLHDRDRFNVFCYSYGKNDGSNFREQIQRNCDRFVELNKLTHSEAAKIIFEDKVDILVDLAGHTEGNRMEICALRPAPVQARYLGMPGTTGSDYFDYIITDPIVAPNEDAPYYSEKFVHLPHCYQINSSGPLITEHSFRREELGLPRNGFVFCSFNTNYKLDPVMYDSWMRIMKRVQGSVLWLLKGNEIVEQNLKQEAEVRTIEPDRLVFAPKIPKDEHLKRLQVAGLALDSRIVNGAITTSDALWSGVPVITLRGNHFASRMSSSILCAIGMQNLVTTSLEQYESLAVHLALNPRELEKVKYKLRINRETEPLFDTPKFSRHLEKAYSIMWENWLTADKPRYIQVER
jgi:protein O-GlcNAc transferase